MSTKKFCQNSKFSVTAGTCCTYFFPPWWWVWCGGGHTHWTRLALRTELDSHHSVTTYPGRVGGFLPEALCPIWNGAKLWRLYKCRVPKRQQPTNQPCSSLAISKRCTENLWQGQRITKSLHCHIYLLPYINLNNKKILFAPPPPSPASVKILPTSLRLASFHSSIKILPTSLTQIYFLSSQNFTTSHKLAFFHSSIKILPTSLNP